jgi:two-component system, cell cycle sensor histidine kinase and response regulator CckA
VENSKRATEDPRPGARAVPTAGPGPVEIPGGLEDFSVRTEEALRESEEKFRKAFLTHPDSININRLQDGMYVSINHGFTEIMGYTEADVIGRTSLELNIWADPANRNQLIEGLRARGEVRNLEARFRKKDGGVIDGLMSASIIEIRGVRHILSVARDVTERKRAEETLRESEQRYRDLAESLPLTVFETDREGRLIYANRKAFEDFGYAREDLAAGISVTQVIASQDRKRAREALARRLAGAPPEHQEYLGLRKDGSTFPIVIVSSPILRQGAVAGLRGIITDVTERRLLDEERLKTQKLQSIGTLAGGIAHDFNNLLQGVYGYISMARLAADDRERSLAMLEHAEQSLHQAAGLAGQLLTFSKGGKPVKKAVALRQILENTVKFALSGSRVVCELAIDRDLRPVEADVGQIGQVIQNIVINAKQSMPRGGTIRISAHNLPASEAAAPPGPGDAGYVQISVRDEGSGIAAANLPRIFDPYFTTKEQGSGLGLATVYSIVSGHGGVITASSEIGKGTTFTVILPATSLEPEGAPARGETVATRRGRILVMDDTEAIRKVAGELIRALGHDVTLTEDGEAAVAAYRAAWDEGCPFDVVILDLTIRGGLGGVETLRRLLEIDPEVKAVVSSGYAEDGILADYRAWGFRAALAKPYRVVALGDLLARLLACPPSVPGGS